MEPKGSPLQLVKLVNCNVDAESSSVEVDEDVLDQLSKRLKEAGAQKVAVISVMGAFRTGKSFLLDLFLRYLRYEESCMAKGVDPEAGPPPPERGSGQEYPLPAWITQAGSTIEGVAGDDGFRFKGGMDVCTEGIWVWSEPFMREIGGEKVALLIFDTQGAWDSTMTKEQSATIFGLTAVLSSKLIYNITQQIQEDKVDNLTYFMQFAQSAIHQASVAMQSEGHQVNEAEVDRPFQCLDFLVRDWRNFRKDMTMEQCSEQMKEHMARHVNPKRVKENSTAEVLNNMFHRISCHCLPHPGLAIQEDCWGGEVADISPDFIRFIDVYVKEVFRTELKPKQILGSDLSALTFPHVLKDFVGAFRDAAPAAMTFTQAITNSTVLLAKEQCMKQYQKKMDKVLRQNSAGLDESKFNEVHDDVQKAVQDSYNHITIFGSEEVRKETWAAIQESLESLRSRYSEDNMRKLEKALAGYAHITIIGFTFFILDKFSDFSCDWWSQTCCEASRLMLLIYLGIFIYVAVKTYLLFGEKGKVAALVAAGELWKEMMRLMGVYGELVSTVNWSELPDVIKKICAGKINEVTNSPDSKKNK